MHVLLILFHIRRPWMKAIETKFIFTMTEIRLNLSLVLSFNEFMPMMITKFNLQRSSVYLFNWRFSKSPIFTCKNITSDWVTSNPDDLSISASLHFMWLWSNPFEITYRSWCECSDHFRITCTYWCKCSNQFKILIVAGCCGVFPGGFPGEPQGVVKL